MNYEFHEFEYATISILSMNMKRKTKTKAPIAARHAVLIVIMLFARSAFGWGSEGHDAIVQMALRMMKASERKAVFDLLGTHDTHYIGHWADAQREKLGNGNLHFVNIPDRDVHYNAERDCPNNDCIIAKLDQVQATIKDHTKSRQSRKEALLYWFHLVGDLYQPFHCYAEKHGGNDIPLLFHKRPTNLHKLWDDNIIWYKQKSARTLAEQIYDDHTRATSPSTTFIDAAERSHERAKKSKLKDDDTVTGDYVSKSWGTIQACLWEAACMAATIGPDV